MSYPLYNRSMRLEFFNQGSDVGWRFNGDQFRIDFDVDLIGAKALNKGTFKLYNANEDTIARAQAKGATLSFFAGYGDITPRIINADITRAVVNRDTVDVILDIECKDSARIWRYATVARAWTKTTAREVIEQISSDVGVVPRFPSDFDSRDDIAFDSGYSVQGMYRDIVSGLAESMGLEFSMQDGVAVFTKKGEPASRRVVLFSPESGVVGRPELKKRKIITLTSLLRGEIKPKRLFGVQGFGEEFKGFYRATKIKFVGSSWDNPYYTKVTGTRVQTG